MINFNDPRQLMLVDGTGALLSAFALGVLLPKFESLFGVPAGWLYPLGLVALAFAAYSLVCYFEVPPCYSRKIGIYGFASLKNYAPFLKMIAVANLLYCSWTLSVVWRLRESITGWGITYFLLEVVIVVSLAAWELRVANRLQFR